MAWGGLDTQQKLAQSCLSVAHTFESQPRVGLGQDKLFVWKNIHSCNCRACPLLFNVFLYLCISPWMFSMRIRFVFVFVFLDGAKLERGTLTFLGAAVQNNHRPPTIFAQIGFVAGFFFIVFF